MEHPFGIKPWGNSLLEEKANIRDFGFGQLACINDELLLMVLGYLDARELTVLSGVSKAFYCFCNHEDLWRTLLLEEYAGLPTWADSWQSTYLHCKGHKLSKKNGCGPTTERTLSEISTQPSRGRHKRQKRNNITVTESQQANERLRVSGFYSDFLYQPWFCATVTLPEEWMAEDNVDRVSKLSVADFIEQYELPNRPVVITDAIQGWAALEKWSFDYLQQAYADQKAIVGNYEMDMSVYMSYLARNHDDMPLYLFDKRFLTSAPSLAQDYSVPEYFSEDLFSVLGESRPDYRWLITGPARSGSSFHVDPNSTSAWNAVVTGRKKWVMTPPGHPPPGVIPSSDGADVTTPVSVVEWFLNFYMAARESKVKPIEVVTHPGEVLFVPRGWWHLALNLEPSIAITQNYVSSTNLEHVLRFLATRRADLVSGCKEEERHTLYTRFVEALQTKKPEVWAAHEHAKELQVKESERRQKLASLLRPKLQINVTIDAQGSGAEQSLESSALGQEIASTSAVPVAENGGAAVEASTSQPAVGFFFNFSNFS